MYNIIFLFVLICLFVLVFVFAFFPHHTRELGGFRLGFLELEHWRLLQSKGLPTKLSTTSDAVHFGRVASTGLVRCLDASEAKAQPRMLKVQSGRGGKAERTWRGVDYSCVLGCASGLQVKLVLSYKRKV